MVFLNEDKKKDELIWALKILINYLQDRYNLTQEQVFDIIKKSLINDFNSEKKDLFIPLHVFHTQKLSSLEIIVKYLKENLEKKYHEIAILLNRDPRTIWVTYRNSLKKNKKKITLFEFKEQKFQNIYVPLSIFSARKKGVLDTLVVYLKNTLNFTFKDISYILLKDYQTVYSSYRKAMKRWEK